MNKEILDPLFAWVIAREYYDGPIAGVASRTRGQGKIFFRSIAWDSEQWNRVFAITPVQDSKVERLRAALTKIEEPKEPFWLPSEATNTPEVLSAWDAVLADVRKSTSWSLVESHDLLDARSEAAQPADLATAIAELVTQGAIRDIDGAPLLTVFLDQLRGR
jgi:hypothetical protein